MGMTQSTNDEDEDVTRKPSDSKFHQQKLNAWQPILTASTILPVFFTIGIIFIPIGIALVTTSSNINEKVIEYSSDKKCDHCKTGLQGKFIKAIKVNCTCNITFKLETKWEGNVFFYYGLSNFYQNHRRYVRSRDDSQIHGTLNPKGVNTNCKPFDKSLKNGSTQWYAPCGAIANSMFTDKFEVISKDHGPIPLTYKNIAWKSDREVKFKNPPGNLTTAFKGFKKPKYWTKPVYKLDEENPANNGFQNQDFIVWMRVAAFPTFRKLYRKLDRTNKKFKNGLPAGEYTLNINYNYPVDSFKGKKRFILTTTSWMGGKNSFLGVAYIVVGCLCLMFGFIFLVIHMKVRTSHGAEISH